ncbi:MAG: glycosyltransferase [Deferrisomatales bacterium]|nr:glycosyltransferase [Deferrisomatales bacterium]
MAAATPQLTVVVPVLDEAKHLPSLLRSLAAQQGLGFEVVLADGGSADGSPAAAAREAELLGLDLHIVVAPPGRARQLNAGAAAARAPELLFLHADSGLPDPHQLARSLASLRRERSLRGHHRVAGHFGLRFARSCTRPSRAYYFYEAKTRLDDPGCIRGDQGFLLSAEYFRDLGGYDATQPYLEDSRLAREIGRTGVWVNLPGTLHTSARRFEVEGLRQRQTLNALLCNFDHIGLHGYFASAADAYRQQGDAGWLELPPFYRLAHRMMAAGGVGSMLKYWYRTGRYIAGNAWQLAFALDCRANQRDGWPPGQGPRLWLGRYRRWGRWLVESVVAGAVTALLTAGWSYGSRAWARLRPRA